ncbi:hypothetical protein AVEN_182318-1 [Araneus ventricosus]|uniref:Uncharacterized protein n=1 Tax=Araneus ventricosus TaxID=182803 RepID=A0A4Y2ICP7_ARAVE|nr:hypothetical protein AVEN_182318-1 [Araneus ventricosus]
MMEYNEPPLVKYEEVLLPDEPVPEPKPGTSKESSDSSTDSDEEEEKEIPMEAGDDGGDLDDPDRAEAVRKETVERILDYVFIPRYCRLASNSFSSLQGGTDSTDKLLIVILHVKTNNFCNRT